MYMSHGTWDTDKDMEMDMDKEMDLDKAMDMYT
jgi:hypothetical protein